MLALVFAPDPVYKTKCTPVTAVDARVRDLLDAMLATVRSQHAIGIGAPMVGITERLVVIEMEDESGILRTYQMVNPQIIARSDEMRTMEEASITFLGISAPVTRPAEVTVRYQDEHGQEQIVEAKGILATCVQHEMDYLDGKTILDYQSPVKRDMLLRKMEKQKRLGAVPHVHGPHCNHG